MPEQKKEYDVIIVGGGTAGVAAAIQSGRVGVRTAVIEKDGILGGTITKGGVSHPGIFHAWGRQVIAGIGWELMVKTLELCNQPIPECKADPTKHWMNQIRINEHTFACLAEEECQQAGVDLRYYEMPVSVKTVGERWEIQTIGKGPNHYDYTCTELIDCTGDADVVGMLGLPRVKPGERQPGTLIYRLGGYDADKVDYEEVNQMFKKALEEQRLKPGDYTYSTEQCEGLIRVYGLNQLHVINADSSTSQTQGQANIDGRSALLRIIRFLKQVPGCENVFIKTMCAETGVRETYRITGEYTITREDYIQGQAFKDAVCFCFYPVDLHVKIGVEKEDLKEGIVPQIPLRALVPQGSSRLLVAGRCISSDRLANSGLRVQAACLAMGQAAGAAAVLGVQQGIPSRDVGIGDIKGLLKQQGAIVP